VSYLSLICFCFLFFYFFCSKQMIHFGCIYGNRTPFIKLGGFYIGYKKFLVCFKPRGDMNDEVMSLCIEMNNIASRAAKEPGLKKYIFSVHAGVSFCKNKQCFILFFLFTFSLQHTLTICCIFQVDPTKTRPINFPTSKTHG